MIKIVSCCWRRVSRSERRWRGPARAGDSFLRRAPKNVPSLLQRLVEFGYSASEFRGAQVAAAACRAASLAVTLLKAGGYDFMSLCQGGYAPKDLKAAGYTAKI